RYVLFRAVSPLRRHRLVARLLVGVDSCGFWFAVARTANCLGRPNTARGTAWIRRVRTACSLPIGSGSVVISIEEQEEEQVEEEKLRPKRFEVLTAIAHQLELSKPASQIAVNHQYGWPVSITHVKSSPS